MLATYHATVKKFQYPRKLLVHNTRYRKVKVRMLHRCVLGGKHVLLTL